MSVPGRRDLVEDVLQEGAMIALRKLDEFDRDTHFAAWMSRIVRYVALNHARRVQRGPVALPETDHMPGEEMRVIPFPMNSRGEMLADQDSFDDEVIAALEGLDETARACLLLRTVMDMPYREISRILDVPEGTAMSHVHRARRTMRERLGGPSSSSTSHIREGS